MATPSQNTTVAANSAEPATNGPPPGASTTTSITSAKTQPLPTSLSPQPPQQQQQSNNFEPLDKSSSNTLKRNPKMELSRTDLLKLLSYLEGELQARDIVIAVLKSERMKHLLSSRYHCGTSDPHAALARDVAIVGGAMEPQANQVNQEITSLEALVMRQRGMHLRMAKILKDAEIRHRAVIKELEEEKRKHEHDTAQGDDITYGLEKERTRLKKELEMEKQEKKKLEAELKKATDTLEEEKNRQKQIVLLLLAERKKVIMKYIEERKRSEDLAQILSEEKVRIDSMAEGLEEESKKSLQMEAELEKQLAQFDIERQQYRQALAKEEKRVKDLEADLEKLKAEMETWKESQARGPLRGVVTATPPAPPAKPVNLASLPTLRPTSVPQTRAVLGTGTPMVSSKVVQPTATVSSVPVSGPTTGIARSVTPRQGVRLRGPTTFTPAMQPTSTGETTTTSEAQAILERPATVAATSNSGGVTKVLPTMQATPEKIPFNVSSATTGAPASGILSTIKKLPISRGVPPPVPPNKPIVPPKKDAVFIRRTEASQLAQDAVKFVKQQQQQQQQAAAAAAATAIASQQPAVAVTNSTDDEAKPR